MRHAHGPMRLLGAAVALVMTLVWRHRPRRCRSPCCARDSSGAPRPGAPTAGTANVYLQSFWGMTAGHNCTNYVAYRLTHGRLVARPPGTNSAMTWGPAAVPAASRSTTSLPSAPCVVGGRSRRAPATSGHVAYVEAVLPGALLVSEDNLHGDFRWRLMTRSDGTWPSGFIHYPASDGSPTGEFTSVTSPEAGTARLLGLGDRIPTAPSWQPDLSGEPRRSSRHRRRGDVHVRERVLPLPPHQQRRYEGPDHDVPLRLEHSGHRRAGRPARAAGRHGPLGVVNARVVRRLVDCPDAAPQAARQPRADPGEWHGRRSCGARPC